MTSTTRLPVEEREGEPERAPRRGRTAVIVVAITVVVAVALGWIVAFSSVLGVRSYDVRGAHVLTVAQVRAAAGVARGTPLVRIDTTVVTRRVERLAVVASAEVSTSFPSTLVIRVVERQPVGYVRTAGGAVLVDRTGDQYRTVPRSPAGLPRFVVPAGTDSRTTGGAVATVAAALPADLRRRVSSIEALDPAAITLVFAHGRVVAWGSAARSTDKARVLAVLLRQKHSRQIDVSNPEQPFTH
jgi:cell division protein FtsQ